MKAFSTQECNGATPACEHFASHLAWLVRSSQILPFMVVEGQGFTAAPDPARFIMPARVEGKDVLVVEDEPYLCDLVADVLEADGHNIRKASNGLEALSLLAEQVPQLILLDLIMPVMDGWQFMAALRANPAWRNIPVVVITAVYDVESTQGETGARAVITKPFDIDQLADIVRSCAA